MPRMRSALIIVCILAVMAGCAKKKLSIANEEYKDVPYASGAEQSLPFETVLNSANRYAGKWVIVSGYMRYAFEGTKLFGTKDDFDGGNDDRAISVGIRADARCTSAELRQLQGGLVSVVGLVRVDPDHQGRPVLELLNIQKKEQP